MYRLYHYIQVVIPKKLQTAPTVNFVYFTLTFESRNEPAEDFEKNCWWCEDGICRGCLILKGEVFISTTDHTHGAFTLGAKDH